MNELGRRETIEVLSSLPDYVPVGRHVRGPDRHRWLDLEDVVRDPMWGPVHFEAADHRGVVPSVHVRGGALVSAAQLELYCRSLAGRLAHRRRLLHRDMGRVGGGGQAAQRLLRPP